MKLSAETINSLIEAKKAAEAVLALTELDYAYLCLENSLYKLDRYITQRMAFKINWAWIWR